MGIKENVVQVLSELPPGCQLVAAVKSRSAAEVLEAVEAGVKIIGENYLQEAEALFPVIGRRVSWHFIGHLQKNKVKKVVALFDLIETIDSIEIAEEINRRAEQLNKVMPVLVEVNSGQEPQKFGVMPEEVTGLLKKICHLPNLKILGLMTMGPFFPEPERLRPYFQETKALWEKIKKEGLPNVEMRYLSMGMSDSYQIAIEEGANLVRIGTKIFGPRPAPF